MGLQQAVAVKEKTVDIGVNLESTPEEGKSPPMMLLF